MRRCYCCPGIPGEDATLCDVISHGNAGNPGRAGNSQGWIPPASATRAVITPPPLLIGTLTIHPSIKATLPSLPSVPRHILPHRNLIIFSPSRLPSSSHLLVNVLNGARNWHLLQRTTLVEEPTAQA